MSKKFQHSVQASIELVQTMDFLEDPIYLLDLDDNIVAGNKAFFDKIGKTPEEAIGTNVVQYFHPDGEEVPCPVCQARLDRRDAVVTMEADDPKNHTGRDMEIQVKVIRNNKKEPIGFIHSIRDMTATLKAEKEIRKSKERFQNLVETTSDWIWEINEKGEYTFASQRVRDLLGYEPEEIIGKTPFHFMPKAEAERVGALFADIIAEHRPFSNLENINNHKDGHEVVLETSGVPVFDEQGEYRGYRGVDRDVTERIRSELKFKRLLEAAPDCMIIADSQGKIILANSQAVELFGYGRDELLGSHIEKLMSKQVREKHVGLRDKFSGNPTVRPMGKRDDLTALHADGHEFPVEISLSPLQTDAGMYTTAVVRDISRRLKEERELERLASFPELNPNPILELAPDGTPTYMNPAAVDLFPDLVELKFDHPALHGVDDFIDELASKGESVVRDIEISGKVYEQMFSYIPDSNVIRMYVWDITKMRDMTRKMAYQATHDPLTGLINRGEFERRVEQEVQTAVFDNRDHALCYLDLDQFKIINDTCGHVAGDALLKQLSQELRDALRSSDTLARLGGDEFGLLLIGCPLHRAAEIAENLRVVVENLRFDWQKRSFSVAVSIGVVPITPESGTMADVLSAADAACYLAKDKGRNRVHVYSPDDSELSRHTSEMNWTHRIKQALTENRFVLFCQEIMPLQADTGSYYEVLVRMLDDKDEIIPPMAFIPAAERYSLMPSIDRWVVRNTFAAIRDHVELAKFKLTINLSGQSISDKVMMGMIINEFDKTGIDPTRICFEITETAAVANLVQARHFILTLKELGCQFALDDFGSGVSSFAYLKALPVDYLKIDGAVVKGIEDDIVSYAMVESINHVGHVMNISTIAEFVENDEILEKLRLLGVDYGQGYGISRPVPIDSLFGMSVKDVSTG